MTTSLPPSSKGRGETVNSLSPEAITAIVQDLYTKGHLQDVERTFKGSVLKFPRCTLACTVDAKGNPKYPQATITRWVAPQDGTQVKALVHLIYWRYSNGNAMIPMDLDISHCDVDHKVLNLTAESRVMNESRKACHSLGWHRPLPSEATARCPHREHPCTGP